MLRLTRTPTPRESLPRGAVWAVTSAAAEAEEAVSVVVAVARDPLARSPTTTTTTTTTTAPTRNLESISIQVKHGRENS